MANISASIIDLLEMLPELRKYALAEADRQQAILELLKGIENELMRDSIKRRMRADASLQPNEQFIDWVKQAFGDAQS